MQNQYKKKKKKVYKLVKWSASYQNLLLLIPKPCSCEMYTFSINQYFSVNVYIVLVFHVTINQYYYDTD